METFNVLGMMSGTSLDGVDLVFVEFQKSSNSYDFKVVAAETYSFSKDWESRLRNAIHLNALDFSILDVELGRYFGNLVNVFLIEKGIDKENVDFVSSHGQTIFHQPEKGMTKQIGNGPQGAAVSGLKWICDFRTMDVAHGGNGAPLVPFGDDALYSDLADVFLNLGGFSNLSFKKDENWHAFDIGPCNLALNKYANILNENISFDFNGELGRKGKVDIVLLESLNNLSFYSLKGPKSLGVEWLNDVFFNEISKHNVSALDILATVYHHIGFVIANEIIKSNLNKVYVTGGGALNSFLIELIEHYAELKLILPDMKIIQFKEAIIFAFLGLKKVQGEVNIMSSVTGAYKDTSGGVIYLP